MNTLRVKWLLLGAVIVLQVMPVSAAQHKESPIAQMWHSIQRAFSPAPAAQHKEGPAPSAQHKE